MIPVDKINPTEQLYSNKLDDGKEYTIAVDRLRQKLSHKNPDLIDIQEDVVKFLAENSGIEPHRLQRLLKLSEEEFLKLPPVIVIWHKDDKWTLIDGNHQYVAAFMGGIKQIRVLSASRQEWTPFLVKGYTPVYKGYSGIP